jgi:hypothetical protein
VLGALSPPVRNKGVIDKVVAILVRLDEKVEVSLSEREEGDDNTLKKSWVLNFKVLYK